MSSRRQHNKRQRPEESSIEEASSEDVAIWQNLNSESINDFLVHLRRHQQQQQQLAPSLAVGESDPNGNDQGQDELGHFFDDPLTDFSMNPNLHGGLPTQDISGWLGSERTDNPFGIHAAGRRASYGPSLGQDEAERLIQHELSLTPASSSGGVASFDQASPMPQPLLDPQPYRPHSSVILPASLPPFGTVLQPDTRPGYQIPQDTQPGRIGLDIGFASMSGPTNHWLLQSRNVGLGPDQSLIPKLNATLHHQQVSAISSDRQATAFRSRRRFEDNCTRMSIPSLQIQNNGRGFVIPVAVDTDRQALTLYQVTVRQSLEYFTAIEDDVNTTVQGRRKSIVANQVGIRCRFCGHIPVRGRARGAVYYPRSLMNLYQGAQNIASVHFQACTELPANLLEKFTTERPRKVFSRAGRRYWVEACRDAGIYEDDNTLWYMPPGHTVNLKAEEEGDRKPHGQPGPSPEHRKIQNDC